ncbi:MAG: polyprenyl synthetase family protein [Patescibacteria group bacterium]
MDIRTELKKFKTELEKVLCKYLNGQIKESAKISLELKMLSEAVEDMTMRGGKRIRAALFYYSYLAHGGKDEKEALTVSMAMELMQTFLLIHDDIIDNDSLRRGGPTAHKSFEKNADQFDKEVDKRLFGISGALLAGDLACSMSNEIIANSKFKPKNVVRALKEFNQVYALEFYGEFLDIYSEAQNGIAERDVVLIHKLKTVPYTFSGPIKMGAILAGADETKLKKLDTYIVSLGVAFQIQDDILGMFGSEEKLGKSTFSDLREGKKTLLTLDALKYADHKQRKIIVKNLGNSAVGFSELEQVRKIVIETGALDRSKEIVQKYVQKAIKSIESSNMKNKSKDFFIGVAKYMAERDY